MGNDGFLPPAGNYRELKSFQKAEIVYDLTYRFCARFPQKGDRTSDQVGQAARSGKQNIVEASGEVVANIARCSIHQANFLLDRQIRRLEEDFVTEACGNAAGAVGGAGSKKRYRSHRIYGTYRTCAALDTEPLISRGSPGSG